MRGETGLAIIGASLCWIAGMTAYSEQYETRTAWTSVAELGDAERARRRALCVEARFPAIVRGVDRGGRRFECDAVLDRLSACCVGMRLRRIVPPGASVFVLVQLAGAAGRCAARVAVHGRVVGAEVRADGLCTVTAEFAHHRFIYACEAG